MLIIDFSYPLRTLEVRATTELTADPDNSTVRKLADKYGARALTLARWSVLVHHVLVARPLSCGSVHPVSTQSTASGPEESGLLTRRSTGAQPCDLDTRGRQITGGFPRATGFQPKVEIGAGAILGRPTSPSRRRSSIDTSAVTAARPGRCARHIRRPRRAIRCALALNGAIRTLGIEIRAGLHTGEVEVMGDDVGGIAVHLAAG